MTAARATGLTVTSNTPDEVRVCHPNGLFPETRDLRVVLSSFNAREDLRLDRVNFMESPAR